MPTSSRQPCPCMVGERIPRSTSWDKEFENLSRAGSWGLFDTFENLCSSLRIQPPASPNQIQGRDNQERENRGGDHPADHGGGDALHDIGAGSVAPHDGQEPEDHGRGRHDDRTDPPARAFDNGFAKIG